MQQKFIVMDKKEIIIIILKVIIYTCTLLLAALGAASLTGCTYKGVYDSKGTGTLIISYTDTTTVNHGNEIYVPKIK